jgi:sterol desaturase/sphingolipid hydroxylase (fatty acid hydroxylase superfamily)
LALVESILNELVAERSELTWAIAIFAVSIPIELLFGTGHKVAWSERAGNVGAMLIHYVIGLTILTAFLDLSIGRHLIGYPDGPRWPAFENPVLYGVTALFLIDGLYYVYHRLQHAIPALWHIHKLHHTDPAVNVTTAKRTHFLERPVQFVILVAPVLWLLGVSLEGLAYVAVLGPALLYVSHMDVRLPLGPLTGVVVGPQYHRIHHEKVEHSRHANFAQAFPLFDMLGGTYRRPGKSEYATTGVAGCETIADRWRPLL